MNEQPPYWTSEEQTFKTGMLLGRLSGAGIDAFPDTDFDGNFMNEITVKLDEGPPPIFVKIKVL